MATLGTLGQAYTGKVIDPSQGGAVVDYSQAQQFQSNPTITPSALVSSQPRNPVVSEYTPPQNMGAELQSTINDSQKIIDQQYAPLPNEAQQSTLQRQIAELTGQSSPEMEAVRRSQLESNPELQAQRQNVQELTNQLRSIQAQANAIPLQLEQQSVGQGITSRVLSAQQQSAVRNNTIQALQTSALLQGAQGNLSLALDSVDRAIKAEFEPRRAELVALQANLDSIRNDPASTREEKKRAAVAQLQLDTRKKQTDTEERNKETIQALALQALQNGAPAVIVDRIMKSADISAAFQNSIGYASKETAQSIQEYNFYKKQEESAGRNPVSYNEYQNMDANRKIAIAKAGVSKTSTGLPSNIATQVDKLSAAFDSSPIVKNYNEVQNKKLSVDSILDTGIKGPADLALVYEFMKALDPTSVVRETEYSTAAASGNIFSGLYAKYNGYLTEGGGFLPEQVKKDFQTIIDKKFGVATSQYDNLRKETARKIDMKTGSADGVDYLTDYGAAVASGQKEVKSSLPTAVQQKIQSQITVEGQNAYLPRSVWDSLGADKDAVLAEAAADGYKLLIR